MASSDGSVLPPGRAVCSTATLAPAEPAPSSRSWPSGYGECDRVSKGGSPCSDVLPAGPRGTEIGAKTLHSLDLRLTPRVVNQCGRSDAASRCALVGLVFFGRLLTMGFGRRLAGFVAASFDTNITPYQFHGSKAASAVLITTLASSFPSTSSPITNRR